MPKKITIVNRHYPPNINITGENARDLAAYLIEKHQIEVAIVHIDRTYEGGGGVKTPVGKTFALPTIYSGNKPIWRHLSSFYDGFMLIRKAIQINHGPIICMTSPPLLPMWAAILLKNRNRKWMLWAMDFFPEGFAASNQMKENGWFYKWCIQKTYAFAPSKIIALGPMQAAYAQEKYQQQIPNVLLPCGVFIEKNKEESIPSWKTDAELIYLGYCGNISQAHSEDFLMAIINAVNPDKHRLVLALYGTKADQMRAFAANRPGIIILKTVPRNQLHHIDVHLVSLVNSWTHIAVPSKAVSSICAGASMIFCGNKASDNWQLLQTAGWLIEDDSNKQQAVKSLLENMTMEMVMAKKKNAVQLATELETLIQQSYDSIASWAE
jgi:hypothetical protein